MTFQQCFFSFSTLRPTFFGKTLLAQVVSVPVGRRSGGRLATTLVATVKVLQYYDKKSKKRNRVKITTKKK